MTWGGRGAGHSRSTNVNPFSSLILTFFFNQVQFLSKIITFQNILWLHTKRSNEKTQNPIKNRNKLIN